MLEQNLEKYNYFAGKLDELTRVTKNVDSPTLNVLKMLRILETIYKDGEKEGYESGYSEACNVKLN